MRGIQPRDLSGMKLGRLRVICFDRLHSFPSGQKMARWRCVCDCGVEISVLKRALVSGNTKSCGCLKVDLNATDHIIHGHCPSRTGKQTPEYYTWKAMHGRCRQKSYHGWHNYGGRGIKVCERWNSFANFLKNMGSRPEGKTLDRYPDKNGNYEPGNCRWATPKEQAANSRKRTARK